jgi:hypothetical protein
MAFFCRKQLEASLRVGERLKRAREDKQISLGMISNITRIPVKYLEAIECGCFEMLPEAKAHRIAYVREYAKALELNPESFVYQFGKEADMENYAQKHPLNALKIRPYNSLSFLLKNTAVIIFILGFLGYLFWQINGILQPPKLVIYTPADGYVTSHLNTLVQGETEKEVKVTVNGKEIMTNERGQFEAMVDLSNGVNAITISAVKKHGKTTTVTRHAVVKNALTEKIGVNY